MPGLLRPGVLPGRRHRLVLELVGLMGTVTALPARDATHRHWAPAQQSWPGPIHVSRIVDTEGRTWLQIPPSWRDEAPLCGSYRHVGGYRQDCRRTSAWVLADNLQQTLCAACLVAALVVDVAASPDLSTPPETACGDLA